MSAFPSKGRGGGPLAATMFLLVTLMASVAVVCTSNHSSPREPYIRPELMGQCSPRSRMASYYDEEYLLGGCGRPSVDGFPKSLPDELLHEGLQNIGGDRIRKLLDKLRSGKPIAVHAFGGSISLQNGGCWNYGQCVPSCPDVVPDCDLIKENKLYPSCGCYLTQKNKAISLLKVGVDMYEKRNPDKHDKIWELPVPPVEALGFGKNAPWWLLIAFLYVVCTEPRRARCIASLHCLVVLPLFIIRGGRARAAIVHTVLREVHAVHQYNLPSS